MKKLKKEWTWEVWTGLNIKSNSFKMWTVFLDFGETSWKLKAPKLALGWVILMCSAEHLVDNSSYQWKYNIFLKLKELCSHFPGIGIPSSCWCGVNWFLVRRGDLTPEVFLVCINLTAALFSSGRGRGELEILEDEYGQHRLVKMIDKWGGEQEQMWDTERQKQMFRFRVLSSQSPCLSKRQK